MRRTLAISLLALSLCSTVFAGEVPFPGKQDPPPCTQNCTSSTTQPEPMPESGTLTKGLIEIVLGLITLRP